MANITEPQLTYRVAGGNPLTHDQMNNNFRSLVYSSSVSPDGEQLRLHYDIVGGYCHCIPLNGGSGGLSVTPNTVCQIVTTTGTAGSLQSESDFKFGNNLLDLTGTFSINDGEENIIIGASAGGDVPSGRNTSIGINAGNAISNGLYNTAVGYGALLKATTSQKSVGIGYGALSNLITGNCNVGIGNSVGAKVEGGDSNVLIGESAGPTAVGSISNKLYINNSESDTPLILGDFSTQQITFSGGVTGSSFTGSFVGDGSGLTGVTATAEWDGSIDGDVSITGSLIVSGSDVTVDFTNVESISGSIFSGSFVGDGSLLTGVQAETFPYTGSAIISGSLLVEDSTILSGSTTVSGSFTVHGPSDLNGEVIADRNIVIRNGNTDGFTPLNIGIGERALQFGGTRTFSSGAVVYSTANIAIGSNALGGRRYDTFSNSSGMYDSNSSRDFCFNTAIGFYSQASSCIVGISNTSLGSYALYKGGIGYNTAIGAFAIMSCNRRSQHSSGVGYSSLRYIDCGIGNTAFGSFSLNSLNNGSQNLAVGFQALRYLKANTTGTGNTIQYSNLPVNNTGIGTSAGICSRNGSGNVYIGACAGPSIQTEESNKLYINNAASANPLILGDFSTGHVTIHSTVSASVFSGSFIGNGSGLTDIEWDGSRNGDGEITGSFTVSGSDVTVDFTNTLAISGSTFSGSFVGDGSGLTGITAGEWDGTRNGDAEITGSLIVSGALDVSNTITLGSTGYPGSPGVELIHFHSSSLSGTHTIFDFTIGGNGYTGFKADYTLNTESEDEKKVGTLLGAWDQSTGATINDAHTVATGNILGTSFSIDSDGSNALLKLDASTGTYNVNMLITAFKRQV